ncbi:MAG: hypothetical protein ACHQUC_04510 [Chlamydiales bacterium]
MADNISGISQTTGGEGFKPTDHKPDPSSYKGRSFKIKTAETDPTPSKKGPVTMDDLKNTYFLKDGEIVLDKNGKPKTYYDAFTEMLGQQSAQESQKIMRKHEEKQKKNMKGNQ